MSILLIGSPTGVKLYAAPQLGPFRIQHYLKKHGFKCDIYDPDLECLVDGEKSAAHYNIIAISGNHFNLDGCLELVEYFVSRQPQKPLIVAGGVAPTNDFKTWLDLGFDVVSLGYGEESILGLAKAYEPDMDKNKWASAVSNISGIAYEWNGTIIHTPPKPLTADNFKFYAHDLALEQLLPYQLYWDFNKRIVNQLSTSIKSFIIKTVRLYTSSQCPNRCGYCDAKFCEESLGQPVRAVSLKAPEVLDLIIDSCQKYDCESIFFNDDEFLNNRKMVIELCRLIIESKIAGKIRADLSFECQSRVVDFIRSHQVDAELIQILDKAGFGRISLGVENFSAHLLSTPIMNKAQYSREDVEAVIAIFQQSSLSLQLNFMLMIPEANRDDLLYNIKCIIDLIHKRVVINLNVKITAAPGAPAVKSKKYKISSKSIISPLNKRRIEVPDCFLPNDPDLKHYFQKLEQQITYEKKNLLQTANKNADRLPNTVNALISCLALLSLMQEDELYKKAAALLKQITTSTSIN